MFYYLRIVEYISFYKTRFNEKPVTAATEGDALTVSIQTPVMMPK